MTKGGMGMTPVLALCAVLLAFDAPATAQPPAAPTATPPPVVTAWLGISLGESPKDVRAQLGKPREIVASSVGDLWRYDIDSGNVTLELVVNNDQVLNIAARVKDGKRSSLVDPFGGALGMTAGALRSLRGAPLASYDDGAHLAYGENSGIRWFYSLDAGAVTGIEVSKPLPARAPAEIITDPAHDGSRIDRAFIVKASTQTDGTNAELAYVHKLQCENSGAWQVTGQELVPAGGRYFDLLHVTCSTTKLPRDLYFDITTSFGK
jgi:hypothetical protein